MDSCHQLKDNALLHELMPHTHNYRRMCFTKFASVAFKFGHIYLPKNVLCALIENWYGFHCGHIGCGAAEPTSECAKCVGWIDSFATATLTHGAIIAIITHCGSATVAATASAAHPIAALTWIVAAVHSSALSMSRIFWCSFVDRCNNSFRCSCVLALPVRLVYWSSLSLTTRTSSANA